MPGRFSVWHTAAARILVAPCAQLYATRCSTGNERADLPAPRSIRQNVLMSQVPRLTDRHIHFVHRDVIDSGAWPGLEHFTEQQYDEHLAAFLQDRPEGPIGVFAYGSLIWKPVFEPSAVLPATTLGWHRAFTLRLKRFRGTPECPGLMMQIDRGGTCRGILQIVPRDQEWQILSELWRREMTVRPPGNYPRWLEVDVEGQIRNAVAFTANPESPNYAGRLTLDEVAACLSEACGHWGSGAEYLLQTIAALEREGIHDTHLWELQERVADIIEARFPDRDGQPSRTEHGDKGQGAG
jgi:glutathione-specific gamma-glutamylcyclotransferase